MATTIDPDDRAAIEALAASGLWQRAGLVEARRLQELLKQQECLDGLKKLGSVPPQANPAQESMPNPSPLTEIERELIGEMLTLSDEGGLTREQTLSLLGQMSVLVELVKQRQVQ